MIEVRPARESDADALCAAHVEGWRTGYRGVLPDALLDSEAFRESRRVQWRSAWWLRDEHQAVFAGTIDGAVLGFANVGHERIDGAAREFGRGEVYAFYLHPDSWGSGLATELMDAGLRWLREQGHADAVLWVLRDNPRARAFYAKTGWQSTDEVSMWDGPQFAGVRLPAPVAEVRFIRAL